MTPHIVCGCPIVAFSDRIRYAVPHIVCGSQIHVHCAAFTPAAPQDREEKKKHKKKKHKKDKKRHGDSEEEHKDRKKKKQEKKERRKKREEEAVRPEDEAIEDAIDDANAVRYDHEGNVQSRSPAYNADALAVDVPSTEEVADAAAGIAETPASSAKSKSKGKKR